MPGWVILGLVLAVLLAVVAYQEVRPRRERPQRPLVVAAPGSPAPSERVQAGTPLSPAEGAFFRLLRQAVGSRYVPLAKVHLPALLPGLAATSGFEEALSRSADFVLLEADSLQPLLVIQYDAGGRRDGLVTAVLSRAGLPVVEANGQVEWTPQSLSALIVDALTRRARL